MSNIMQTQFFHWPGLGHTADEITNQLKNYVIYFFLTHTNEVMRQGKKRSLTLSACWIVWDNMIKMNRTKNDCVVTYIIMLQLVQGAIEMLCGT